MESTVLGNIGGGHRPAEADLQGRGSGTGRRLAQLFETGWLALQQLLLNHHEQDRQSQRQQQGAST
jgi:hypothetical protein